MQTIKCSLHFCSDQIGVLIIHALAAARQATAVKVGSKRGDVYLRTLLIHGARTVIQWREESPKDKQGLWLKGLIERRGINRATVALANKNARRMWVLMARDEEYREAA